jgi:hypothetical protein
VEIDLTKLEKIAQHEAGALQIERYSPEGTSEQEYEISI